jgi:hypothetical protein
MRVIILGTGATIGTLRVKGGVEHFVDRLDAVNRVWRNHYPNLDRLIQDCCISNKHTSLDTIWTRVDYYSKFRNILGSEYGADASVELHKAVLEAYAFRSEIDKLIRTSDNSTFTLKSELNLLKTGDALISFNWDTLAERIAADMLQKHLVQAPHPTANENIRLIKPHGSLSWIHEVGGSIKYRDGDKPRFDPMELSDYNGGKQPLILGAVPIKSELLQEIQQQEGNLHDVVAGQWRETVEAISQAAEIVVSGYSFPKEDAYGRFLFQEAFRSRKRDMDLPKLRYYSLCKDRKAVRQAIRDIAGSKVKIKYAGHITAA